MGVQLCGIAPVRGGDIHIFLWLRNKCGNTWPNNSKYLTQPLYGPFTPNTPLRYLAIASTVSQETQLPEYFLWTKTPVKLDKTELWWAKGLSTTVPDNQFMLFNEKSAKKYGFLKQGRATVISIFLQPILPALQLGVTLISVSALLANCSCSCLFLQGLGCYWKGRKEEEGSEGVRLSVA